MVRVTPMVLSGAVLVCAVLGCANFVEMQAINNFTTALQKDDLDRLKASASNSFDTKALRHRKIHSKHSRICRSTPTKK